MRATPFRLLCLALAIATTPALARGPNVEQVPLETLMSLQVEGEVDIDAAGNVLDYRLDAAPPESVRPAVDRTIRGWHFVSRSDGEAVQPQTITMRMSLAANEAGGKYVAKIENVWLTAKAKGKQRPAVDVDTATIQPTSMRAPRYPSGLATLGVAAKVLVGVRLGTDGKVAEAVVVQSALLDAQDQSEGARRALKYFEDSALDGAKRWRFDVAVHGVPTPDDLTVLVPINYMPEQRESMSRWHSIVRTLRTPLPWLPASDDRTRLGVADVGNDGTVPDAADVRLANDPAGAIL
jgi:hypothetical protein